MVAALSDPDHRGTGTGRTWRYGSYWVARRYGSTSGSRSNRCSGSNRSNRLPGSDRGDRRYRPDTSPSSPAGIHRRRLATQTLTLPGEGSYLVVVISTSLLEAIQSTFA